jgi:hypothetical protein
MFQCPSRYGIIGLTELNYTEPWSVVLRHKVYWRLGLTHSLESKLAFKLL